MPGHAIRSWKTKPNPSDKSEPGTRRAHFDEAGRQRRQARSLRLRRGRTGRWATRGTGRRGGAGSLFRGSCMDGAWCGGYGTVGAWFGCIEPAARYGAPLAPLIAGSLEQPIMACGNTQGFSLQSISRLRPCVPRSRLQRAPGVSLRASGHSPYRGRLALCSSLLLCLEFLRSCPG
jgi:hypothetical protein